MNISEKHLEDIIYYATNDELVKAGLHFGNLKFKRQVRIGNYGIADLIGYEIIKDGDVDYLYIELIELKKETINADAFWQSVRYARGILRYFQERRTTLEVRINIVLIGSVIDNSNEFVYLPDLFSSSIIDTSPVMGIDFYTFSININGFCFTKHSGYLLKEEGFNIPTKSYSKEQENPFADDTNPFSDIFG